MPISSRIKIALLLGPAVLASSHAVAREDWMGLKGHYFRGGDLSELRVTRLDDQIDFNWGWLSPDWRVPVDDFSARWTGKLKPPSADLYTVFLRSDDGGRLWIDGRLVIDRWNVQLTPESSAMLYLSNAAHTIKVEYRESWGVARVTLSWSSARMSKRAIPRQQLSVAAPPEQRADGPGGSALPHGGVKETVFVPSADLEYRLYEPQMPTVDSAPVVIFLHGWGGLQPGPNRAWIDHIVRRGNIVIWPRYQASLLTPPRLFTPNAVAAVKLALAQLQKDWPARPRPDLGKVAAIGHSMGGILAANLAAVASTAGLPTIRAVMAVTPGTGDHDEIIEDLSAIASGTLLISVAASDDTDRWSTLLMQRTVNVAPADKNHVTVQSDDYGWPSLVADHFSPLAATPEEADALDWYGYWKWFDALADTAFYGINRNYALGGTPEQVDMGSWSDQTAVKQPIVVDGSRF